MWVPSLANLVVARASVAVGGVMRVSLCWPHSAISGRSYVTRHQLVLVYFLAPLS